MRHVETERALLIGQALALAGLPRRTPDWKFGASPALTGCLQRGEARNETGQEATQGAEVQTQAI